jgi:hypothetical protein
MAADYEGKKIVEGLHALLRSHSIWVWKAGCIEDVTGTTQKGEDAIILCEAEMQGMTSEELASQMPDLVECFSWIRTVAGVQVSPTDQ